jgi:FAD/FMN-containing dehydrogenase
MVKRVSGPGQWTNWHETVSGPIKGIDKISYPSDNPPYGADAINRCTAQLQRAIAAAKAAGEPYRAVGRGWSLSDAPYVDGLLLDNSLLIGRKRLRADQVDPDYRGSAQARDGLCLIQSGTYVSELNAWLESDPIGLSLRTSGAANGQTIAGAMSTGIHGSALDVGAFHDHVVAIHLLAGPARQVWLERAGYPVLKPTMAQSLGAELIRDDDMFNAVLVGLGAFGVIHNVVIEARPRFTLRAYNYGTDRNGQRLTLNPAVRQRIKELDFAASPELNPVGENGRPYFFQPIINPNVNPPDVLITQMYEQPWPAGYRPDYRTRQDGFGPGFDFISVAGRALDLFRNLVPLFANLVSQQMFKLGLTTGSWGEIFGYKTMRTKVASGSVAVPAARVLDALDALIALNKEIGPVPLVFGCRYQRKSPALLAINRWDPTAVISIDGIYNPSSLKFLDAVPARMEAKGIPFAQHWGKINGYTPARVEAAFGQDRDKWLAARHALLPDPVDRVLFENDFVRRAGLAG